MNQRDIDTRSDVYSLGVVLYQLLSGNTPFDPQRLRSAAYEDMLRIIREEDPPKPSTRISESSTLPSVAAKRRLEPLQLLSMIRGELDWIVMKTLEKERSRRYQTVGELAADVHRYLNDDCVIACPPSTAYRLRKFVARHRTSFFTASALALMLVASTIVSTWQAWRANRAAASERVARQLADNARQREQRESAKINSQIRTVLAEVDRQRAGIRPARTHSSVRWQRLVDTAAHARALAGSSFAERALRKRAIAACSELDAESKDFAFMHGLEDAEMRMMQVDLQFSRLRVELLIPEYESLFQDYGIIPYRTPTNEAAAIFASRPTLFRETMIAALTDWSVLIRREQSANNSKKAAWILDVLASVDCDPWRCQMRMASLNDLARLAEQPEIADQPPAIVAQAALRLAASRKYRRRGIALLQRVQREHPDDFRVNSNLAVLESDSQRALRFAAAAVALRPQNAAAQLNYGAALSGVGANQDAIDVYERLLEREPRYAAAILNLAIAHAREKDWERAFAAAKSAVALNAANPRAHQLLGEFYQSTGQLAEAELSFRASIDARPTGQTLDQLGVLLAKTNRHDQAIAEFQQALAFEPEYALARNNLAVSLIAQGRFRDAVAECEKAIECDPGLAEAYCNLGIALNKLGDTERASVQLRTAIQINPAFAKALLHLGAILRDQGEMAESIELLQRATESAPSAESLSALGVALAMAGSISKATQSFRQAVSLGPDFAPAHLNLAEALAMQGEYEAAARSYQAAIDQRKDYAQAYCVR